MKENNKVKIMGILNVTPDSFYDGGKYTSIDLALKKTEEMINDGVDIIDIGGESTRPDSLPVKEEEELKRVLPVIKEIKKRFTIKLSIDTYKSKVALESINEGVEIINDISGLRFDNTMLDVVKKYNTELIIMHMQGTPQTMQKNPVYKNVVEDIKEFFLERIKFATENGIKKQNLILDPGIGFGKTTKHNIEILKNIKKFKCLNQKLLIGTSRKSFIGRILATEENPLPPQERLTGSIVTYVWCILEGINILRVHDVKETKHVIKIMETLSVN